MVPRSRVAVAAPHPAATAAAREVVAAGGGAVDAALAAAAALTVVYPHQCSVGGDVIALHRDGRTAETTAVVSAGAAPQGIDVDALRSAGDRMPPGGPLSVTVPGAVAGWSALHRLGARLGFADLIAPAVRLAQKGVAVSPGLARAIENRAEVVDQDRGLSALVRPGGRSREVGESIVQPELADSLRLIAADPDSFYRGELATRLADGLAWLGSPLTADDLAAHRAEVTAPLTADVGDHQWSVAPPPSQGAALLATLVLSDGAVSPGALVRAARVAEVRRDAHLADPRAGAVELERLLGEGPEPAGLPSGAKPAGDTVAVCAVDEAGHAVSLIMSVFQSFGSGLLDPGTGILFHNRGSAFSLDPEHPACVRPGVRPPHTLCPTLIESRSDPTGTLIALGCQGGRAQAWILSQLAADVARTEDPSTLLGRPRWVIGGRDLDLVEPGIRLEPGAPEAAAAAATTLGLDVHRWSGPHDDAGHVQVARRIPDGEARLLDAASDPRADGEGVVL